MSAVIYFCSNETIVEVSNKKVFAFWLRKTVRWCFSRDIKICVKFYIKSLLWAGRMRITIEKTKKIGGFERLCLFTYRLLNVIRGDKSLVCQMNRQGLWLSTQKTPMDKDRKLYRILYRFFYFRRRLKSIWGENILGNT